MNKEEFEILSKKIRPALQSVARNFALASGIETDDVVQDALVAFWELVEQDYPIRDAESLLIRITKNICISNYRKIHLDTQPLQHDNYIGGTEATIRTDCNDLKVIKRDIYNSLSNTQQEYLYLRNYEGLTLDEIARITGKPKTSIKSTISSARKQILNLIKQEI